MVIPPTNRNQQSPVQKPSTAPQKAGLAAIVGTVAAALLFVSIPKDEGTKFIPYKDIVGVWTVCSGDTKNVTPGVKQTAEQCQTRLEQQLAAHAAPVMKCTPTLNEQGRDYQRAAAVSLAYNIGDGAFCKSTVNRLFVAREWKRGCNAFLAWNRAGGRVVPGLTARRQREVAVCLKGL